MKTLGRILIISFVFTLFAGLMILAVNASGMNAPNFEGNGLGRPEFRPSNGNTEGGLPFLPQEERGERGEGGSRWVFGMIKNIAVITILVIAIVWPKSIIRRKKRASGQT